MTQSATDRRPQSLAELAGISGVGDRKLEPESVFAQPGFHPNALM